MGSYETALEITNNVEKILKGFKLAVEKVAYGDEVTINTAASEKALLIYDGQWFENVLGHRAGYSVLKLLIKVIILKKVPAELQRRQLELVAKLKEGFTVDALNVNGLAFSKMVSLVKHLEPAIDNQAEYTVINYLIEVRFREG